MSLSLKDFQPINRWSHDSSYALQEVDEIPDLIDETTKRLYRNEPEWIIRFKCTLLTVATPLVHTTAGCLYTAAKILKLVTLSHFWLPSQAEKRYGLKARLHHAASDMARIIIFPFALLGLELSALYGLVRPYDGRKLYASFERSLYGKPLLAPCFQPRLAQEKE